MIVPTYQLPDVREALVRFADGCRVGGLGFYLEAQ